MEKNYYEILEIDKNASAEVIDKAYKTLAKKYHPDLQDEAHKKEAEEKMKELNEAFEIISDPEKREKYNKTLEINNNNINREYQQPQNNENNNTNSNQNQTQNTNSSQIYRTQTQNVNQYANNQQQYEKELHEQKMKYAEEIKNAVNQAYHDAYIQDLKNRGYRIRYKKSIKDYLKIFLVTIVTIVILVLICQIPFVKSYLQNLYNENEIIKWFVDFITRFFNNLFS